ncbi:MAG TPA: cupredoxin domain-containing protein [Thermoanaerobaculia bacterium]|nr:cupredoxin domain-containing protein [Thermoanaerobaculia bacterium]
MRFRARWAVTGLVPVLLLAAAAGRSAEPRVVKISAKRFEFSPPEVHLKKGETVVLEVTSEDRVHGFNIPAFKIRRDIVPKEVTRVTLTPDKAGTFSFRCDVFCGDGHEDMTGTLIVPE